MGEDNTWIIDVDARNFETEVMARSLTTPVLLDFWATWCGPCKTLGPALEKRAREGNGRFLLAKVDIDQNPELAQALRVQAVPTVLALVQGQLVDGFQGALPDAELDAFLDRIAPGGGAEATEVNEAKQRLEEGDLEGAIELLKQHMRAAPDDVEARILYAGALLDADRLEDARKVFEKVPEDALASDAAQALAKRLDFVADAGELEPLQARVQENPADLEARVALGRAYIAAKDAEQGLETLLEVVREGTGGPQGDEAKQAMLETFEILGLEDPVANDYRFKLSLELFS